MCYLLGSQESLASQPRLCPLTTEEVSGAEGLFVTTVFDVHAGWETVTSATTWVPVSSPSC